MYLTRPTRGQHSGKTASVDGFFPCQNLQTTQNMSRDRPSEQNSARADIDHSWHKAVSQPAVANIGLRTFCFMG